MMRMRVARIDDYAYVQVSHPNFKSVVRASIFKCFLVVQTCRSFLALMPRF